MATSLIFTWTNRCLSVICVQIFSDNTMHVPLVVLFVLACFGVITVNVACAIEWSLYTLVSNWFASQWCGVLIQSCTRFCESLIHQASYCVFLFNLPCNYIHSRSYLKNVCWVAPRVKGVIILILYKLPSNLRTSFNSCKISLIVFLHAFCSVNRGPSAWIWNSFCSPSFPFPFRSSNS
jgi:hypothetical protein